MVLLGAGLAQWPPEWVLTGIAVLLFDNFGVLALRNSRAEEDELSPENGGHSIFASTFVLLVLAQMGDKTRRVWGLAAPKTGVLSLVMCCLAPRQPGLQGLPGADSAVSGTSGLPPASGERATTGIGWPQTRCERE